MEHTIEPWKYVGHRNFHPDHWVKSGFTMYAITVPHDNGPWESVFARTEANARRIVACVNACAGLSTEDLEQATEVRLGFEDHVTIVTTWRNKA